MSNSAVTCPHCGSVNPEDNLFCMKCGGSCHHDLKERWDQGTKSEFQLGSSGSQPKTTEFMTSEPSARSNSTMPLQANGHMLTQKGSSQGHSQRDEEPRLGLAILSILAVMAIAAFFIGGLLVAGVDPGIIAACIFLAFFGVLIAASWLYERFVGRFRPPPSQEVEALTAKIFGIASRPDST